MNKVVFYLSNPTLPYKEYNFITEGNPGIGGSEYEFLLVSFLLDQRDNNIDTYLFVDFDGGYPHSNVVKVKNLDECCSKCISLGIRTIVIDIKQFDKEVLGKYADKIDVLVWAHNNPNYYMLNLFNKLTYVKQIINCGREELEYYRDHIATLKSTYVYNIFPVKSKDYYKKNIDFSDNHKVVYMGSLVREKGFHVLAKAWPNVLKEIPDAELYVIGSGNLYNSKAEFGPYNVAEKRYESEFMTYLTDKNGKLHSSVHFLGLLGEEKYEVMGSCKVGVPNPTGMTETFCICGIEMQLMGCNITTIKHPAYYDTVWNKDSLFEVESQLANSIIKRIKEQRDDYNALYNFIESNFSSKGNIEKWEDIIRNPIKSRVEPCSNNYRILKRIKNLILKTKQTVPMFNYLPPLSTLLHIGLIIKGKFINNH